MKPSATTCSRSPQSSVPRWRPARRAVGFGQRVGRPYGRRRAGRGEGRPAGGRVGEAGAKGAGGNDPWESEQQPATFLPPYQPVLLRGIGMNRTFKAAAAALFLALSFAGSVAAGPFEDAAAAYQKGDFATALGLIRPLAEQGGVGAQAQLGLMYDMGRGVPQDYATAMSWYRKAAEQGDAWAQVQLGYMYDMGRGVPQDYAAAAGWYRKAAEQGEVVVQARLGFMYATGEGVPEDFVTAHMWLNLAAASGNKNAAIGRDTLAVKMMTPEQIAEAQKLAREWKPPQKR
jgi:uncharacterized protein